MRRLQALTAIIMVPLTIAAVVIANVAGELGLVGSRGGVYLLWGLFFLNGVIVGLLAVSLTPEKVNEGMNFTTLSRLVSVYAFIGVVGGFVVTTTVGFITQSGAFGDSSTTTTADLILGIIVSGAVTGVGIPFGVLIAEVIIPKPVRRIIPGLGKNLYYESYWDDALRVDVHSELFMEKILDGRYYMPEVFKHCFEREEERYNFTIETWQLDESERVARRPVNVEDMTDELNIPLVDERPDPPHEAVEPYTDTTQEYITDVNVETCAACDGSQYHCVTCNDTGQVSCSIRACDRGSIEQDCACVGEDSHTGRKSISASTGEVLNTCTSCGGDGREAYTSDYCKTCNGKGAIKDTCNQCGGDGVSNVKQCRNCSGTGYVGCGNCNEQRDVPECPKCAAIGEQKVASIITDDFTVPKDEIIQHTSHNQFGHPNTRNFAGGGDVVGDWLVLKGDDEFREVAAGEVSGVPDLTALLRESGNERNELTNDVVDMDDGIKSSYTVERDAVFISGFKIKDSESVSVHDKDKDGIDSSWEFPDPYKTVTNRDKDTNYLRNNDTDFTIRKNDGVLRLLLYCSVGFFGSVIAFEAFLPVFDFVVGTNLASIFPTGVIALPGLITALYFFNSTYVIEEPTEYEKEEET